MSKRKEINIAKKIPLCKNEEVYKVFESFKITNPKGIGFFVITNLRFIFLSLKKGKSTKGLTWQETPIQDVNGRISSGYGKTIRTGMRKFGAFLIFFALVALIAAFVVPSVAPTLPIQPIVYYGVAGGFVLFSIILFFASIKRMFFIEVLTDHNYHSIIKLSNNSKNQELFSRLYINPSKSTNEMIRDLGKSILDVKAKLSIEKEKGIYSSSALVPGAKQHSVNLVDASGNRLGQVFVNDGERVSNLAIPRRDGVEFENWYLGSEVFNSNTPIQSDLTLVAKWKNVDLRLFKVVFMYGAGKIYAEVPVAENGYLKPVENPIRTGYEFDGWYFGEKLFDFSMPVRDNLILIANWRPVKLPNFTVSFFTIAGKLFRKVEVPKGQFIEPFENPSLKGMQFTGWFLGEELFNFNNPINSDLNLFAGWQEAALEKVNIQFVVDGEVFYKADIDKGSYAPRVAIPQKNGFVFTGWLFNNGYFDFDLPINQDMVLVSAWEAEKPNQKTFVVTYIATMGDIYHREDIIEGENARYIEPPYSDTSIFDGWYYEGRKYDFAKAVNKDITLIAKWNEKILPYYNVKYFSTANKLYHSEQIQENQFAIDLPITREGYEFTGWFFEGELFDFSTPVMKDLTLIANWVELEDDNISVTFIADAGGEIYSEVFVKKGETVPEIEDPFKEDFKFIGWYNFGKVFDFSKPVYDKVILIAKWESLKAVQHTVTFVTTGGEIFLEVDVNDNELIEPVGAPIREGFKFLGWFYKGREFDFTTKIIEDLTLVARWEEVKKHAVTFLVTNGVVFDETEVEDNGYVSPSKAPTREGYKFISWMNKGQEFDFETPITKETILMAKWEAIKKNTVTFVTTGGEIFLEVEVNENELVSSVGAPSREGYYFVGWYYKGKEYDFSKPVTEDLTLLASWEKMEEEQTEVTVKFYANANESYKVVKVPKGKTVYKVVDPERSGYAFKTWCINDEEYDFSKPVDEDLILRAKWDEVKDEEFTVCFLSVGGDVIFTENIEKGKKAFKIADPERAEYNFLGWFVNDQEYDFSKPVEEDLILTAKWEKSVAVKKETTPKPKKVVPELSLEEIYQSTKNFIMKYTALKEAMNKKFEVFSKGNKVLMKLTLVGQSFKLYLRLDESQIDKKYSITNEGDKPAHKDTPVVFKIRNLKTLKQSEDLIRLVMENNGSTPKKTYVDFEYPYPFADPTKLTKVTDAKLAPKTYFPNFGETITVEEYNEKMESKKQKELDEAKQKALQEAEKLKAIRVEENDKLKALSEKEKEAEKQKAQAEKEAAKLKAQKEKEKEAAKLKAQKEKEKEAAKLKAQKEKEKEAAKLKAQKEKEKEAAKLKAQKEKEKEAAKLKAQKEKEKATSTTTVKKTTTAKPKITEAKPMSEDSKDSNSL